MNIYVNKNYYSVLVDFKGMTKLVKPNEEISIDGFLDINGFDLKNKIEIKYDPIAEEIFPKAKTVASDRFSKRFK